MAGRLNNSAVRRGADLWPLVTTPSRQLPPIGLPPGRLGMVEGPGTITFTLNNIPRWVIDVRGFAGTPTLGTRLSPQGTTITLHGARFPGTELPADFVCIVGSTSPFGTPADISFTLGGFHAHAIIENWLAGLQAMQSPIALSGDVCPLGAVSKMAVSGSALARFSPNWLMEIGGPGIATISGLGPAVSGDSFTLKLLLPTDLSISTHPRSKRTLLMLIAGGHSWSLAPAVTNLPIGNLTAAAGLFRRIDIEAGEGPAGDTARELLASSSRADGLTLTVAGGITDLDGNPFSLALAAPNYAVAFDTSPDHSLGDQTFLSSRFADPPRWLAVDGYALLVGDPPGLPGFEAETLKGNVTSLRCQPSLLLAAAPMSSGTGEILVAAPQPFAASVLPFVVSPGAVPGWGIIVGPEVPGRRRISLPDFAVSVVRREDLLSLDFRFFNLALEAGGGSAPQLVRKDPAQASYLVVQFDAPQNITEQAYLEAYTDPPGHLPPPGSTAMDLILAEEAPGSGPALARAAGPSRLAFRLPTGTNALPYSLPDLLNWVELEQSVVPVAKMPDTNQQGVPQPAPITPLPSIREPKATETAIEAPWRLFLSPNYSGAWAHSATPVTLNNRAELWHTRLAVRMPGAGGFVADETISPRVRAVWSPDYSSGDIPGHPAPPFPTPPFTEENAPFRMSLDPDDRDQIVRLSSDFTLSLPAGLPLPYTPISIRADKLFLTSMGAWMDVFGDWPEPLPSGPNAIFSVEQWHHRAAMARDNYVRVVYAGSFLPFGNATSLVKVTERKLQSIDNGRTTAYLRQKFYLHVREPEKSYGSLPASQQRNLPFRKIRITTLVTPDVVPAVDGLGRYSFFPTNGPNTFLFHIIGTDWEGQTSEFTAPLYFVEQGGDIAHAVSVYNGSGTGTRGLSGQKVAFAPHNKPGDTTLHTSTLTFSAQPRAPSPDNPAPVYPQMDGADVVVPSIQQLTGGSGALSIQYFGDYVNNDMGPGEVFAQNAPLRVEFNGKQSGGVATPNLSVSGLSRKFGTVSGATPANVATGKFDVKDIFGDAGAKLFGVINIFDLIDAGINQIDPNAAPILTTERGSTAITTRLEFTPAVHPVYDAPPPFPPGFLTLTFNGEPKATLILNATIVAPLDGGAPQVTIHGELNNFTLSLAKVIGITIDQIAFDAPAGQKLTVKARMPPNDNGPIQFLGDLSFLNTLRKLIPSEGFQDPPSLDVTPDGITAGYTLPIPSIGVGIFSIENISLGAALTLPFFAPYPVRFRFAFSEREHPFLISVSLLSGGGFFGITVGPDGVEILEASIEVGANVSIDVVVASGNVHIMVGVYLKYDMVGSSSQLTGYLRAGGSLDVLGLISASIEFYLGFTYYFGSPHAVPPVPCSIAGEATVTIEVHVLFFSASVSASLRRQFADPQISFADLIPALPGDPPGTSSIWNYYCDSFAA
jgi:hypothetical protein